MPVRLAFSRERTASAPSTTYFLERKDGVTREDTRLLAGILN